VCRVREEPTAEQVRLLDLDRVEGEPRFTVGKGCPQCRDTGYAGRLPVFEYLRVDTDVRRMVSEGRDTDAIAADAVARGMTTLRDDAVAKLCGGRTSLAEAVRVVS
jgi:type II secretory ATPase GspE/PulE/Tfp pilus assembly ATPase PilB-like protein